MDPPFRHSKSRAFISSAELSMKPGAAAAPEGRSRFQKVSLVSRRLEGPRGRDGSPSRVSLLLQAWEREIVEKKTGSGPAAPAHREPPSSAVLRKGFTAHGPIFSQVYAPAQRPRRQDERGKAGPGGDGSPGPEVPVHRESYVHGTLLPTGPAERPAAAPGDGPGAPGAAKAGGAPALPRARQVTVLRTGRDAEGRGAPNGTLGTAGTTAASARRDSPGQEGSGSAGAAEGSESSPGSAEAAVPPEEASPEEKDSAQAEPAPAEAAPVEAAPVEAAPGAGDRPGDPQSSVSSSPQDPSAGQAAPAGTGEGSVADVDGTMPGAPARTESPPGAGSTPETPPSEESDDPEPSSETAASAKAEIELEGDETMGDPQELESTPEPPSETPAPEPPAESPPDASEEDPELLVDMEILVDTLRNMEPSEMRKAPKAPRQPRPSALGRCAALPPIHEHRVAPRAPLALPLPQALRELLERGPAPAAGMLAQVWLPGAVGGPGRRQTRGCGEMAAAAEIPPRSSPARPPGSPLQDDKEGLKINTRPGKVRGRRWGRAGLAGPGRAVWQPCHPSQIILYSEAGFAGHKREIWDDIPDATSWELSHTISIRVIRGGYGRQGQRRGRDTGEGSPGFGSARAAGANYRRAVNYGQPVPTHALPRGAPVTWLLYSKPFFDDDPYVLEPGGYPSLKAWGAKDPSICSMHPIRLGCPVVERPGEPQVLIYEAAAFQGRSFTVSRDIYDLRRLPEAALPTVGSLRVLGGCWVGYEKEGFRGHQYLLEEGEYRDWRHWGGYSPELVSLRLIRTDFSEPALVLFEAMDFEAGASVELSEALPDTGLAGYGSVTQSIHVLSGVWVAYEGPNYSGEQYILEKGVYRSCEDWGATDCHIASAQPILQVREHNLHFVSKILLFSEPDFLGDHVAFEEDQGALPEAFAPRSCRVRGGSWILFDGQDFTGEQHVLSEGEYPTLSAMGCLCSTAICSLRKVPWVLCEHGDFRGRQWLLDCTEITNWLTYSGLQHVGSLYPIRQRRVYFHIRSRELQLLLSVPDDVEDMKAGRVVVSSLSEQSSSVWYYEDGLIKNQVAPTMSLQVIGPAGKGAKAVLWSETRLPRQTWSVDSQGRIHSQMFEDMVLDIKGGRNYDRDHAVVWDMAEERPTQLWDIQVL
uniref:Crystallin beta-gamma domain containing 2 n=1 Tax=Junco hyemalis TaxID=40217 RepID=A0A8C5NIX6_JUNHY